MYSNIISRMPASKREGYVINPKTTEKTLQKLGIGYTKQAMDQFIAAYAAKGIARDAAPNLMSVPSVPTPIQFLQVFLPKTIRYVTKARKIENLINTNIVGSWADEEIIIKTLEYTGQVRPYGDNTDIPEASFNANMEPRTIVRFEEGFSTTVLAAERMARIQINETEEKRAALMEALAIEMNRIGFYGYNDGSNRTYGFFNDPNLPPYQTVAPEDQDGTLVYGWDQKSFTAKCRDFTRALSQLRTQTGERIDPRTASITAAVSSRKREDLTVPNEYGRTVEDWLRENYANVTLESAPELDGANGGSDIMIMYVNQMEDQSTIDLNHVERLRLIGTEIKVKGIIEGYSCASAGVMVNMPLGIVRFSGI